MILHRYTPNPIYFRFDLDTGIKQKPYRHTLGLIRIYHLHTTKYVKNRKTPGELFS